MAAHPYDVIFVGLSFDIAGAVILAKGFMFKGARAAYFESRTMFGGNAHALRSALFQRAEAQVGASLLILGFFLQIWGNLHGGISASEPGWINSLSRVIVAMIAVATSAGVVLQLWLWRARVAFYRIFFRNYTGAKLAMPEGDRAWLDRTALLLGLKRKRNEANSVLLARVELRRAELGAKYRNRAPAFVDEE